MFSYKPHFIPNKIVVIGVGGTGSRLLPMLTQLVRSSLNYYNPRSWIAKLPIFLVDPDVVEAKNLLRQNFIERDLGLPKANVLASRYSAAYGVDIYSCPEKIDATSPSLSFINYKEPVPFTLENAIIILAVDSANARRDILKHLFYNSTGIRNSLFIIDAGNEDDFGQIKFFTNSFVYGEYLPEKYKDLAFVPKALVENISVDYIPMDFKYYATLGSSVSEKSCADLPQTLAINAMMATLICCVVQNFIQLIPMTYDGLRFSLKGAMETEYNTPRRWLRRLVPEFYTTKLSYADFKNGPKEEANKINFSLAGRELDRILLIPNDKILAPISNTERELNKKGLGIDIDGNIISLVKPSPLQNISNEKQLEPVIEKVPARKRSKATTSIAVETEAPTTGVAATGIPPLIPIPDPVIPMTIEPEVGRLGVPPVSRPAVIVEPRPATIPATPPAFDHNLRPLPPVIQPVNVIPQPVV